MKLMHVLLVEDNEGDIMLTTGILEDSNLIKKITVMRDGEAAIDYFNNLADKYDYPDIVLLDINLPKKNGHEVLAFIKNSDQLRHIPVVVLTTSSSDEDILKSYKHFVNCYITKPIGVDEFATAISKIQDFWINLASTPRL